MKTLLDINTEYSLELNGLKYRLLEVAGQGGSSIVYKAKEERKRDYVIIKEFCPHDLGINRAKDGSIFIPVNKKADYERRKLRVLNESEIVAKLRYNDEVKNQNPWFLSYEEPLEANNTLYTIIATESGDMLSNMIKNGYFIDKDFLNIFDCILNILDALKPIHDQGYLHLDISPDNIHFSDLKIARLIDYNSAFRIGDDSKNWLPSIKIGYSANELIECSPTKLPLLSYATDLYSVTAIFFELLIGRTPQEGDWSNRKQWQLNNKTGYLINGSYLLVKKTNDFLTKGLSISPSRRFKDINEMRDALEELKELWIKYELADNNKRPYEHFIGRKPELIQIDDFLKNDSFVFLEGIGGIGKSELAKRYAQEYKDNYDIIQFITYKRDLTSTIANDLCFRNFQKEKYYELYEADEAIKQIFNEKMTLLKNYDKRTLIIIDNYNVDFDDNFHRFIDGNYKVIFTSRERHDVNVIEVSKMKNENDLFELFYEYYKPKKVDTENEYLIHEIIKLILGHTMTVMLIASAMRINGINPDEMLKRLKDSLNPELLKKIPVSKEELNKEVREQIMYQHILNLFDMEEFSKVNNENKNYAKILTNMAIVPHEGLEIKNLYKWAFNEQNEDVTFEDLMQLIKLRWVQYDEDTRFVSLHPVISDVANSKLQPDSIKCTNLINTYIQFDELDKSRTYVEKINYCVNLMKLAYKRIYDKSKLTVILLTKYALLNSLSVHYDIAIDCYNKLILLCNDIINESRHENELSLYKFCLCEAYTNKGFTHSKLREYDKALVCYDKGIEIGERLSGDAQLYSYGSLAMIYMNRSCIYSIFKKYDLALQDANKSISMYEKILEKDKLSDDDENGLANAYKNRSAVYESLQMYNESSNDLEKCMTMWDIMKAEGKQFNITDYTKALINKSVKETNYLIKKNGLELDKKAQSNLVKGMMAFRKKKQ